MDTAITDHNIAKDHRLTAYMQQSLSQHASTISGVLPLSTEIKRGVVNSHAPCRYL
jgi:hypothetical protein